jgi:hypothetical protein
LELRPHYKGIEISPDRSAERRPGDAATGRGREALVDAAVHEIEHEAHVGVRVPVDPGGIDRLLAPADGIAGGGGDDARGEVVIEGYRAEARRQFDGAETELVIPRRERVLRNGVRVAAARREVNAMLAGRDPGRLDIAAIKTVGRQPVPDPP